MAAASRVEVFRASIIGCFQGFLRGIKEDGHLFSEFKSRPAFRKLPSFAGNNRSNLSDALSFHQRGYFTSEQASEKFPDEEAKEKEAKWGSHVHIMENDNNKKEFRRKLKEQRMEEVREKQRLEREAYKARKPPTPVDILVRKIELAKKKVAQTRLQLKKYDVPNTDTFTTPSLSCSPEILTQEEMHFWKRMGQKYRNYVPVGRRGIYGGTIQNMHLHWKKHETVRIDCHMFSDQQITVMAKDLARLSGGIVVDIRRDKVVVLYRGSKYQQPKELIPRNLLDKRKALKKSLLEQSMNSVLLNIRNMEKKLRQMKLEMGLEYNQSSASRSIVENAPLSTSQVASDDSKEDSSEKFDSTTIMSFGSTTFEEEESVDMNTESSCIGGRKVPSFHGAAV